MINLEKQATLPDDFWRRATKIMLCLQVAWIGMALCLPSPVRAQTAPSGPMPHIRSLVSGENGRLRLEACVPASQLYAPQSSTDLVRWRRVAGLSTTDSANIVAEIEAPTNGQGFSARPLKRSRYGATCSRKKSLPQFSTSKYCG